MTPRKCVDCGTDIAARVARYHLARRCESCTNALNAVRAVTRYAAEPRREIRAAEPSEIGLEILELERLRAEARLLYRAYLRAPPLSLVRANEVRQREVRARISRMLAAVDAETPAALRTRFAGGGWRPGWHLQW